MTSKSTANLVFRTLSWTYPSDKLTWQMKQPTKKCHVTNGCKPSPCPLQKCLLCGVSPRLSQTDPFCNAPSIGSLGNYVKRNFHLGSYSQYINSMHACSFLSNFFNITSALSKPFLKKNRSSVCAETLSECHFIVNLFNTKEGENTYPSLPRSTIGCAQPQLGPK